MPKSPRTTTHGRDARTGEFTTVKKRASIQRPTLLSAYPSRDTENEEEIARKIPLASTSQPDLLPMAATSQGSRRVPCCIVFEH
jgi:hypothetical protein